MRDSTRQIVSTTLERWLLPVLAAVMVIAVVTNPLKWDWQYQLSVGIMILGAAIGIGHTIEKMRKPKVAVAAPVAGAELPKPTPTAAPDMAQATAQPAPAPTPAPKHPHPGAPHVSNDDDKKHDKPAAEPPVSMVQNNSGNASGNFQLYKPTINIGPQRRMIDPSTAAKVAQIFAVLQPKRVSMHYASGSREVITLANAVWQVMQSGGWTLVDNGPWMGYPCEGADADVIVVAHQPATDLETAIAHALQKLGLKAGVCPSQGDAGTDLVKLIVQGAS